MITWVWFATNCFYLLKTKLPAFQRDISYYYDVETYEAFGQS